MTGVAADPREEVVRYGRLIRSRGLAIGTSGNLSLRLPDGTIAVSPASLDYDAMTTDDVVILDAASGKVVAGGRRPSSETPLHLAIYAARPAVGAIVHSHSPFATTFSTARRPIPAVHYVAALLVAPGGDQVRCASYATFGTRELAAKALAALGDDSAVLLANHGAVTVGTTLASAFVRAERVEELAMLAWRAEAIGGAVLLTAGELDAARDQMGRHPTQR